MLRIFHVRRVLLVGLLGLLVSLPASDAAQQLAKKPAQKPFTLTLTSVKVKATKPGGGPWDTIGGLPDLVVRIVLTDAARHKQLQALYRERDPLQTRLSALDDLKKQEVLLQKLKPNDPQRRGLEATVKEKRQTIRPLNAQETARLKELQPLIEKLYRDLVIHTGEASNTLEAVFDTGSLPVAVGDELTITVTDHDFFGHDEVGFLQCKLTAEQLKQDELDLAFGQVISLKLAVKPNR
ncbi:MAG: hypothetical protein JNM56_11715 [Planctomycetia bacterium]|nr:hypothetical protein [Planctomycetia bacterium]